MMRAVLVSLMALVIGSVGCSDDTDDKGTGGTAGGGQAGADYYCDLRIADGTCVDYLDDVTQADAEATCDGTVNTGSCPGTDAIAECERDGLLLVYYASDWDIDTAETDCLDAGGSFEEQ